MEAATSLLGLATAGDGVYGGGQEHAAAPRGRKRLRATKDQLQDKLARKDKQLEFHRALRQCLEQELSELKDQLVRANAAARQLVQEKAALEAAQQGLEKGHKWATERLERAKKLLERAKPEIIIARRLRRRENDMTISCEEVTKILEEARVASRDGRHKSPAEMPTRDPEDLGKGARQLRSGVKVGSVSNRNSQEEMAKKP